MINLGRILNVYYLYYYSVAFAANKFLFQKFNQNIFSSAHVHIFIKYTNKFKILFRLEVREKFKSRK